MLNSTSSKESTTVITGASSGIGRELAIELAKKGRSLVITGRNESALLALSNELSSYAKITYLVCDLKKKEGRRQLKNLLESISIDLLINNAGLGYWGDFISQTDDEIEEMIEVNIDAVVDLTKAAVKRWSELGCAGMVLNVSSVAGLFPMPKEAIYGATKAFVTSFSKALDFELRKTSIRVLTSAPGPVSTDFSRRASKKNQVNASAYSISASSAAKEILKQIEKKKRFHIFDFRMHLFSLISRYLVPENLVLHIIARSIEEKL